jgi:predicted CXXCH cytochrome family protein
MSNNNGSPTAGVTEIRADSCAGCHRIHTSQSPTGFLLTSTGTVTEFCRSCHGATGTGASTDVDTGVQYAVGGVESDATRLGALRAGGFVKARIGSDSAYRLVSDTGSVSSAKVPVALNLAPQPVTSAHLALGPIADGGNGLTAKNVVWGNEPLGTPGAGPTLAEEMECTACHNPHGNGNYRILNGIPEAGDEQTLAATEVNVSDAPYDPARTRNYTVIQTAGTIPAGAVPTAAEVATWRLYADQITGFDQSSGDYLHKTLPYNTNTSVTYPFDAPNARPNTSDRTTSHLWWRGDPAGFNMQMTAWCAQCHTRYMAPSGSRSLPGSIDNIYKFRHTTAYNRTCTTCHVAHGTNAVMNDDPAIGTTYSANVPYPDGSAPTGNNSRLLKVDNRGTCQLCHDPTNGSAADQLVVRISIATSSPGNPAVITTTAAHNFVTGDTVTISGHSGSTPDINGSRVVTVTSATTFTIPVDVTVGGTGGTVWKPVLLPQGPVPAYNP